VIRHESFRELFVAALALDHFRKSLIRHEIGSGAHLLLRGGRLATVVPPLVIQEDIVANLL